MSIDLYFAGGLCKEADEYIEKNSLCRLLSYYNDKSTLATRFSGERFKSRLFVDSGAFTAWTKGAVINTDDYIDFLNINSEHINLAGQLDAIAGTFGIKPTVHQLIKAGEDTWDNYLYMRSKLNNKNLILYTFHIYEDFKCLQTALDYLDEDGNPLQYIALGGTVGTPVADRIKFFTKCFNIIKNSSNPNIKVHGFGLTNFSVITMFPFYSVDSTYALKTAAMGNIFTDYGVYYIADGQNSKLLKEFVTKQGFDMAELVDSYKARTIYNIKYQQNLADNHIYTGYANKKKLF